MALTQSARMPGPSWDEEVVPALRKRLETESRTLARRISAISMSSNNDDPLSAFSSTAAFTEANALHTQQNNYQQSSSSQQPRPGYHQYQPTHPDHSITPRSSTRVNGVASTRKPITTSFHRSRTYSQPYATDSNGSTLPKPNSGNARNPSRSPRLVDAKPTRIPKASRGPSGTSQSAGSPPMPSLVNGVSHNNTVSTPLQTPNLNHASDLRSYNFPSSTSFQANLGQSQPSRIINEPPPFSTTGSVTSSSGVSLHDTLDARPRLSTDSEERPFEHWYRGEVSRNGGVGELRVGRRQEMLEIANYGHAINNKRKAVASRKAALVALEDSRRHRKRADSVAGIGTKGRERGSLYLDDDELADKIARVLDEDPLTDLDGETSDIGSILGHYRYSNHNPDDDFIGDATAILSESPPQETHVARNITPTPTTPHQPKSRQNSSSSRIPAPSEPRSSESRVSTPTQHLARGRPEPSHIPPTTTPSPPPPLPAPSSSMGFPHPPASTSSTPMSTKRGASPGAPGSTSTKKSRTGPNAPKATKTKNLAAIKKAEEDARRSVAHYPSPGDGEDIVYAIPSWTQPKSKEGNWDDVVLPVVARKRGLDDQYEKADGSPQPKKHDNAPIAPAPGTFGYDGTKYRRGHEEAEEIQMDEFGRPNLESDDEDQRPQSPQTPDSEVDDRVRDKTEVSVAHDNVRVPIKPPPSPPPFAGYEPTKIYSVTQVTAKPKQDFDVAGQKEDDGAGCCKCVIM